MISSFGLSVNIACPFEARLRLTALVTVKTLLALLRKWQMPLSVSLPTKTALSCSSFSSFQAITPCPYLPVPAGNVRKKAFGDIWHGSDLLAALRDPDRLGGKCGRCEYRRACGGCRARAYGVRRRRGDACGGPVHPGAPDGDILAEDPCCPYEPGQGEMKHDLPAPGYP